MTRIHQRLSELERRTGGDGLSGAWERVIVPVGGDEERIIAEQFPQGRPVRLIIRRIVVPKPRGQTDEG